MKKDWMRCMKYQLIDILNIRIDVSNENNDCCFWLQREKEVRELLWAVFIDIY